MRWRAMTLIELLVVISIIALMIGILLPVLGSAKDSVKLVRCQSNLHQIATATLTYEVDHNRLPTHPYEMGDLNTVPASIKGPTFDARPLYAPYMNVDFFACPNIRPWRPSQTVRAMIAIDYALVSGYYGDGTGDGSGGVFGNFWKQSQRPWRFNNHRMTVLAGDRCYLDPVSSPGTYRHIVNHPGQAKGFVEWSPPGFAGSAWLSNMPAGVDVRRQTTNNFAFSDGHVTNYGPPSTDLIEMPSRMTVRIGSNYLLPISR